MIFSKIFALKLFISVHLRALLLDFEQLATGSFGLPDTLLFSLFLILGFLAPGGLRHPWSASVRLI